ncbi:MAG: YqhA family protein [Chloroflexota bacterium]
MASENDPNQLPYAPFAHAVGSSRFIVLLGVAAVLLISAALFILGVGITLISIWNTTLALLAGQLSVSDLSVEFLEIVTVMLKAVFFYLIGVGLYSLFIAPLNLPVALGVQTLNDLETKIVSVVVVILAVTFLEHYITWTNTSEILQNGVSLALVVLALVLFQWVTHITKESRDTIGLETRVDAQRQLFRDDNERRVPPQTLQMDNDSSERQDSSATEANPEPRR